MGIPVAALCLFFLFIAPPAETPSVQIGSQVWMARNLDTDHFANGVAIEEVRNDTAWKLCGEQKRACWCYYMNSEDSGKKYGKLYNWYAVHDTNGLASAGWHVPTKAEWETLFNACGGESEAGDMLKAGDGWAAGGNGSKPNGFNLLPGSIRVMDWRTFGGGRTFSVVPCQYGGVWSATDTGLKAWGYTFCYLNTIARGNSYLEGVGFSVRCVKN